MAKSTRPAIGSALGRADLTGLALRLTVLFAIIFCSGLGAILVAKQSLIVAGVWLGNAFAIVALIRRPSTSAHDQLVPMMTVVFLATFAANLAAGNSLADSSVFTAGNCAEVLAGHLILKHHPLSPARVLVSQNPVSRLIQPLLLAAIFAPAVGATIGALLHSARLDEGFFTIWIQWWLPSALGILLVVPPGLLLSNTVIAELLAEKPVARDLLLLLAAGAALVTLVIITSHLAFIMLATPIVLIAAIRYHGIGATIAILVCILPLIPISANDSGEFVSTMPTAGERLALLQGAAVVMGLVSLWIASMLDEKTVLLTALEKSRSELRSQLSERRRLLMSVAHDIRTPLSVIEGCSELLIIGPREAVRDERLVQAIGDSAASLKTLANELLETARREAVTLTVDPEWFDPSRLLGAVIDELTILSKAGSLSVTLESNTQVWADRARFRQIATNLISNALKYGGQYGPVSVRVFATDGATLLTVSDRGPGITASQLHAIFEPFGASQAPVSTESAGFGLNMVRQFAEAHGGWVRCISTPFVETRMEVFFPNQGSDATPVTTSSSVTSVDPATIF